MSFYARLFASFKKRVLSSGGTIEGEKHGRSSLQSVGMELIDKASLIITPNGYQAGVLMAVKPDGSGFAFTQNTGNGTRINKDGQLEVLAANMPRINWVDGKPNILIEEEKTNLALFSNKFDEFITIDASIVQSANKDIQGLPFSIITENTANSNHQFYNNSVDVVEGNTYSFWVVVKPNGRSVIRLRGFGGLDLLAFYNLDTETVSGESTSETPSIISLGDGWYLCNTTFIASSSYSITFRIYLCKVEGNITYEGDGESGILISQWQIEEGAKSSYIPTNGAIATRNADIATVTPPSGTLEIKEFLTDGTINTKTTIPATYQTPIGSYKKIVFYESYIDAFVFVVKTDNTGTSDNNQFTIPTIGGDYDYNIETDEHNLTGQTGDVTLTFAVAGTYTVKITGIFPRIYFNNGGDSLKLLEVLNQGDPNWNRADQTRAFFGCSNLITFGWNVKFMNDVVMAFNMFRETGISGELPSGMTLAALETGFSMFWNSNISGSLPLGMTLSNLTDGRSMLRNLPLLSGAPSLDLASLTTGVAMFLDTTLNTTDYSNLLIRTEISNPNNSIVFGGGNSKYNAAGQTARNLLTTDQLWDIADGGLEV